MAAGSVPAPNPDWLLRHPWLREAGVPVTTDTAVQVSAVYGCCRLIVDSLASAPVKVYEVAGRGQRTTRHDDPTAYILNWGAGVAQAPDAPSSQAIEEALYWSALLWGNGYAEIQRDMAGKFFALWPIEPDRVTPRRDDSGAYYYEIAQPMGGTGRVEPRNMFHLRGPSLFGWVGDSIVFRAAKAIGIAQASQVFAAAYFANGTVLSGILKHPGKLTPDQKKRFGEQWKQNWAGPDKSHGTPILDQGLDYQSINHDAQKAQLVESRRFQVQEIARFFGVPTTLLADNEAWTNLSELYLGFYRNALLPWAERFDAEATRKLFPERQPWREVQHDLTSLVMGTEAYKRTVESLRSAVNGGLKTRNEARSILGDNTLGDDGDVVVVEGTVQTLERVLEPPEPAPAALPTAPKEPDEDDEEDPEDPPTPMPRRNVARAAVALDRFARRLQARKGEGGALDSGERQKLLPPMISECREAWGLDLPADFDMRAEVAADAVLSGDSPHIAADRLMEVQ